MARLVHDCGAEIEVSPGSWDTCGACGASICPADTAHLIPPDPSEPGRQAAVAAVDGDVNHPAHPTHW